MKIENEDIIKTERHVLKVKKSFVVLGEIQTPGTFIEVSKDDATELRTRGLADNAVLSEIDASTVIVDDSKPMVVDAARLGVTPRGRA